MISAKQSRNFFAASFTVCTGAFVELRYEKKIWDFGMTVEYLLMSVSQTQNRFSMEPVFAMPLRWDVVRQRNYGHCWEPSNAGCNPSLKASNGLSNKFRVLDPTSSVITSFLTSTTASRAGAKHLQTGFGKQCAIQHCSIGRNGITNSCSSVLYLVYNCSFRGLPRISPRSRMVEKPVFNAGNISTLERRGRCTRSKCIRERIHAEISLGLLPDVRHVGENTEHPGACYIIYNTSNLVRRSWRCRAFFTQWGLDATVEQNSKIRADCRYPWWLAMDRKEHGGQKSTKWCSTACAIKNKLTRSWQKTSSTFSRHSDQMNRWKSRWTDSKLYYRHPRRILHWSNGRPWTSCCRSSRNRNLSDWRFHGYSWRVCWM